MYLAQKCGDTIFTSFTVNNYCKWDGHFSYESKEGLAICRAKAVPSFLSYFKTLSIGPVLAIEPMISLSTMLSVKLTNLILKKILVCTYMKRSKATLYCSKNKVQTTDTQNPVESCTKSGSEKIGKVNMKSKTNPCCNLSIRTCLSILL